jgi:FkbM family methyltransferase
LYWISVLILVFILKYLSDLVGETGKVYAFEPDKTNFHHLRNNTQNLTNVEFINKAVSDKTGKITLYKSELLNVDHKTYETENYTEKIEIDCVAADDVVADKKVDFIKIDIQGFEYFAFQGMQQIFDSNKNLKIITEFYPLRICTMQKLMLLIFLNYCGKIISLFTNLKTK